MNILKEVTDLENKQQWQAAKEILFEQWEKNKDDLGILVRLGTLCWYILVFWERIENVGLDNKSFNDTLEIVTSYGIDKFNDNVEFLWIFGYMISIFPYYFGDYFEYENIGKKMIEKAYNLAPNDPLIKMLFLNDDSEEYKVACRKVSSSLNKRFNEDNPINRYFKNVFERL